MMLQADLAALDHAGRRIDAIREGLVEQHAALRRQVDDLLDARWRGQAADQFRAAWTQWAAGMSDVLSGLGVESAAIASTRAELAGTDDDRAASARLLDERLGS